MKDKNKDNKKSKKNKKNLWKRCKKSVFFSSILIIAIFLTACGGKTDAETHTDAVEVIEEVAATPMPIEETETVTVEGEDPLGILPQTIEKTITYQKDATTGEILEESEICKSWKINHKKLGGTAWKKSTEDGEVYLRLRDTIEFFYTNVGPDKSTERVAFETTILGAMATMKDGEMMLERIHILSGTVTAEGIITLEIDVYDMEKQSYKEEKLELVLNDFEKIEKADLPFSDEEYKEVAAW